MQKKNQDRLSCANLYANRTKNGGRRLPNVKHINAMENYLLSHSLIIFPNLSNRKSSELKVLLLGSPIDSFVRFFP